MSAKYKLPRYPDGRPFTFSRRPILDGRIRVMYGPDQRPDAGAARGTADSYPVSSLGAWDTSSHRKSYTAPGDWTKPGFLLRVPQVVYLSIDVSTLSSVRQDETDALKAEARRLAGVYAEAKERIEALRPGRTFVSLVDWTAPDSKNEFNVARLVFSWQSILGVMHKSGAYEGGDGCVSYRYSDSNSIVSILMPAVDFTVTDFFATDFLNIFVGFPNYWRTDGSHVGEGFQYVLGDYHLDTPPGVNPYSGTFTSTYHATNYISDLEDRFAPGLIDALKARLAAWYEKFPGYAMRAFTTNVGVEATPLPFSTGADTAPDGGVQFASAVVGSGYDLIYRERWARESFDQLFAELGEEYDLRRVDHSSVLTADYLVETIASHYGFDPETGRDLG